MVEIDSNTIKVEDLNTPLTSMDRSSRQKINKETMTLNDTLVQMDLIDVYRTFYPKAAEYTFFSSEITLNTQWHGYSKKDRKYQVLVCM